MTIWAWMDVMQFKQASYMSPFKSGVYYFFGHTQITEINTKILDKIPKFERY